MDGVRSAVVKSDLFTVGFLGVEGILALGKTLPFAGRRGNEGLGRFVRTRGASSLSAEEPTTKEGARGAQMRRGTSTLVVLRQQAAGGGVLHSGRLGPCSPALSSNDHRRKRWPGRGVARKRRRVRAVVFEVVISRRACNVGRASSEGLSRLVALVILLRQGKVAAP